MWDQYKMGNVTENELVLLSIDNYMNFRNKLEAIHPEDLPDKQANYIWKELISSKRQDRMMNRLYGLS